ncbi:MAG: hypothetical protein QOE93_1045 [Actinomycetota bacterium]|jgi:hypothetical protein|nr:hypothetical protein [Actinomycetota bacterium]
MSSGACRRHTRVLPRETAAEVVLVRGDDEIACWPYEVEGPVDLAVVDELAQMQVAARRLGCSLRLREVCPELSELVAFLGLARAVTGVVAAVVGLPLEVGGEAEDGEEARVEEVVVADDPVA